MEFTIQHDCEDKCHLVACIHNLVVEVLVPCIDHLVCESSGCLHQLPGCEHFGCLHLSPGCVNSGCLYLLSGCENSGCSHLYLIWLPTSIPWLCSSSFIMQLWAEILAFRPVDSGTAVVRIGFRLPSSISTFGLYVLLLNI